MPKGGKRQGAGRPTGSKNMTSRQIAVRLLAKAKGITPLEVMVQAMERHHKAGRYDEAAAVAKDAAPYMHPRLQAVEHTGKDGGPMEHRDVSAKPDLAGLSTRYIPKPRLNGKANGHANGSGNGADH